MSIFWRLFSSSGTFNPDTDIPDLSGKVIIVTGGNSGVGKESVLQLAKHRPARLYLAARSQAKYDAAMVDIVQAVPDAQVTFLELDLASFASVKAAADTVIAANDRLDLLMNNAGVMALPPALTKDGYEIHFGTNHMGHALLTRLLTPLMLATAARPDVAPGDVRVINVSSQAEMLSPRKDGGFLQELSRTTMAEYHPYTNYGHSKLANVLFTKELARRHAGVITTAVIHPGRVRTPLLDTYFSKGFSFMGLFQSIYDVFAMVPVEKGALNQLWAATAPAATAVTETETETEKGKSKGKVVKSGSYYEPIGKEGGESAAARDPKTALRLWEWTEAEFKRLGY